MKPKYKMNPKMKLKLDDYRKRKGKRKLRVQRIVSRLVEFLTWWLWRRWRIYCPRRSVAHLFNQNRRLVMTPYGLMEFPSRDEFENALFHYDEAFVTPCTFNETNCGGYRGRWTPKIGWLSMEMPENG